MLSDLEWARAYADYRASSLVDPVTRHDAQADEAMTLLAQGEIDAALDVLGLPVIGRVDDSKELEAVLI